MKNYNLVTQNKNQANTRYEGIFAKWVHKRFFKTPGKLVDIGSGNGSASLGFKRLGYDVIALDTDDFYFKRLQDNDIKTKKIDLDNSKKLPFKDNEIDYFFAKSVLEHLKEPLLFIKEMNRCLKPNGKIFILTPDWQKSIKVFYNDPTHKSPFSQPSIKKALTITGFKIKLIKNFKSIPYIWRYVGIKAMDFTWIFPTEMIIIAEKING